MLFRGKKSKILRDFQGQIRGKIGRFRGKKVKIRSKIGPVRVIFVGEKSKFAEKSADFAGFWRKKSNFEGFSVQILRKIG